MEFKFVTWNIRGMNIEDKQKEFSLFIKNERLQMCAALETHLKSNSIVNVCNKVYESCDLVTKFFLSIVYASNSGKERRLLWNDLVLQKGITYQQPWVLLGDFNVTLKPDEHITGGSNVTEDMQEFINCINSIEVKDICSTGFHFTWTRSLKNPNCNTRKKLDRRGSYLLLNWWTRNVEGCSMYKLVKKLKLLKKDLNNLNWSHGNLFTKVKELRTQEYDVAKKDEIKLLQQQARIKWLTEGDKNTSFFHGILKSRRQKSKVDSICDEVGTRHFGDQAAVQFVKHFQQFLGVNSDVRPLEEMGDIFSTKLSVNEAMAMVKEVTDQEIKEAIFDIDSNKVAGPDGYSSHFF
ncbi:uncharacterized protein [Rutidosis leptorrhynchoides]|uniref:uncharacterized protein n=1 Tax=Rutidosis leptorrhynchoides TaxID=125765 RepID=UPI003A99DE18